MPVPAHVPGCPPAITPRRCARGFEESTGIVKLRLAGSCSGCPSSSVTLRQGVERMLKHYIPEVKGIEEVVEDELVKLNQKEAAELEAKIQTEEPK